VVVDLGVQGGAEAVGGEDVQSAVLHEGGDVGHRVQETLHSWPHALPCWTATGAGSGSRRSDEVVEVGSFCVVEVQRPGDAFEDIVGDALGVAALEAGVVLDAHSCEAGNFVSTEARDPAAGAVDRYARLFRGDPGSTGGEELSDLLAVVHGGHGTSASRVQGVPVRTPHDRHSLPDGTCR
jgi:hypothetical protein